MKLVHALVLAFLFVSVAQAEDSKTTYVCDGRFHKGQVTKIVVSWNDEGSELRLSYVDRAGKRKKDIGTPYGEMGTGYSLKNLGYKIFIGGRTKTAADGTELYRAEIASDLGVTAVFWCQKDEPQKPTVNTGSADSSR